MLICIKQHLSNIWSSILENVKQHGVKKDVAYKKSVYIAKYEKLEEMLLDIS